MARSNIFIHIKKYLEIKDLDKILQRGEGQLYFFSFLSGYKVLKEITFCKLIIYDLNSMQNKIKIHRDIFFYYILSKKQC